MSILVFGHSYVRDLANFDTVKNYYGRSVDYIAQPGARFNNLEKVDLAIQSQPEIIIIVLGGNDFVNTPDIIQIKNDALSLFFRLKEEISNLHLVVCQIDHRHYIGNLHNSVPIEEHQALIQTFNNWIKRKKVVDQVILTTGWSKDQYFFKSGGIHLNQYGLTRLSDSIYSIIAQFYD